MPQPSARQITDAEAMDAIHRALNEPTAWSPDELDTIAAIVERTGRRITDGDDA